MRTGEKQGPTQSADETLHALHPAINSLAARTATAIQEQRSSLNRRYAPTVAQILALVQRFAMLLGSRAAHITTIRQHQLLERWNHRDKVSQKGKCAV